MNTAMVWLGLEVLMRLKFRVSSFEFRDRMTLAPERTRNSELETRNLFHVFVWYATS